MTKSKKIELLAPAGDLEILKIAVGNGADSVYFGTNFFNARSKARNIPLQQVEEAIDYAHLYGVRAYLALNTLLLDRELDQAEEIAISAARFGIDAIIIQDLGFADRLKQRLPELPLHASTQATLYDSYAVDACAKLGIARIILPRELSIPDIRKLSAYAADQGIETEVFAHGAQCVCYSGQCLLSSLIGGRSGNRGECAQPCRLSYDQTEAGRVIQRGVSSLSARDLTAIDHIEELSDVGVFALKIEGRMRSPEYVGVVTQVFRNAIDRLNEKRIPTEKNALLLAFNRGGSFSDHMLRGAKGPESFTGSYTGSYGVRVGEVAAKNSVLGVIDVLPDTGDNTLNTEKPERGDVLSIRRLSNGAEREIISAPIGQAQPVGERIRIKGFHPDAIEKTEIGDKVYRMSNAVLFKEALTRNDARILLKGRLYGETDTLFLTVEVIRGISNGIRYTGEIREPWTAESPEKIASRCIRQLSKTGGTPFEIEKIHLDIFPQVSVSALNRLRRETLEGLEKTIKNYFKRPEIGLASDGGSLENTKKYDDTRLCDYSKVIEFVEKMDRYPDDSTESVLSRKHAVSASFYRWDGKVSSVECGADYYVLPVIAFLNDGAFDGLQNLRRDNPDSGIYISMPPSTGEALAQFTDLLYKLSAVGIDGIVSGDPGHPFLSQKLGIEAWQDLSANVTNAQTAALLTRFKAKSIALSPELSQEAIHDLVSHLQVLLSAVTIPTVPVSENPEIPLQIELAAYGRLRLMVSEHCPIGFNRKSCNLCAGKETSFALRDPTGASFPVVCHPEYCTADLLNADILCVPEEIKEISDMIDESFAGRLIARLIFTDETFEQRKRLVEQYQCLLAADRFESKNHTLTESIRDTAGQIARASHCKITRGHYRRGV
jgi:U32 family peptidase